MKYTVLWTQTAEEDLARVWLNAKSRQAVTQACHVVDALLAEDAEQRGDLQFDTVRSLVVGPVGVDFEVIAEDCLVYVLSVWNLTHQNPP